MKNVGETHCDLCAWMVENEADIRSGNAVLNGVQWTFQTQGVSVVIDKSDSEEFDGKVIDFNGDEFLVVERHEVFTRDSLMDGDA